MKFKGCFRGHLRRVIVSPDRDAPDRDLLSRFTEEKDEDAFAALVRRHSGMVMGVGLRVLRCRQTAEDVAQATFLLLARKARATSWQPSVANWLYGVAYRLALNARTAERRRSAHESSVPAKPLPDTLAEVAFLELRAALDEEINRLPGRYRAPVVLCCLEGKTRDEAAHCLGVPLVRVKHLLEEGRKRLSQRLARRGLSFSLALATATLPGTVSAIPPANVLTLGRLAAIVAGGAGGAQAVRPEVATLFHQGARVMFLSQLRIALAVVSTACLVAAGAAGVAYRSVARAEGGKPPGAAARSESPAPGVGLEPKEADPEDTPAAKRKKALEELKKSYALKDGEDLKAVKVPFPDARFAYQSIMHNRPYGPDDPSGLLFHWNKGQLRDEGGLYGAVFDVRKALSTVAGVQREEIEGADELLKTRVEADFVVRPGLSTEQVAAEMEKVLQRDFGLSVKLSVQQLERTVYVASGKYRFTPVKGGAKNRLEVYAKDLGHPDDGGGGSGHFDEFLKGAGGFIRKRIVAGTIEGAPKGALEWHYNVADVYDIRSKRPGVWDAWHDPAGVLKHLAEQTGLTFKEESRKVRVLMVEALGAEKAPPAANPPARAPEPAPPQGSPAEQVRTLLGQYGAAEAEAARKQAVALRAAQTDEERAKAHAIRPDADAFAARFVRIAEEHPKDDAAMGALLWVVRHTHSVAGKPESPHAKARALALKNHATHPKMGQFCLAMMFEMFDPNVVPYLRQVREKADGPTRAQATYALAKLLERRAQAAHGFQMQTTANKAAGDKVVAALSEAYGAGAIAELNNSDSARQRREAEELLDAIVRDKDLAATPFRRGDDELAKLDKTTVGELAARELFNLRQLVPGKPAPEIAGESVDGKPLKLSGYRGRVVLVVFCGNWCSPCRALYPHERALVEKYKARPFAIVGVSSDGSREECRKVLAKEKLNWPWIWDGMDGPVAKRWAVDSWPTIYLLDHTGAIVQSVGGLVGTKKGDELIEEKVREAEAAAKK